MAKQLKKEKYSMWDSVQTALWGYSTVILLIFIIVALLPQKAHSGGSDGLGWIIFAPILLFLLCVVFEFKKYRWNWWKYLLGVYTLLIILLVTVVSFGDKGQPTHHNANLYGAALLFLPNQFSQHFKIISSLLSLKTE